MPEHTSPRIPDHRVAAELKRIRAELALVRRQEKIQASRENLLDYIEFTMPDHDAPNDVTRSQYQAAPHHKAICSAVQTFVEGGYEGYNILILTMPPRHGKSEIVSRCLPAWYSGRFPRENVVVASYGDEFAADFGTEVRRRINGREHKQVFPKHSLIRGGTAKDRLNTRDGGLLFFVGRGAALTGRGAHCFVAGTSVLSGDGARQIEEIRVGEKIVAYEEGRFCLRDVQAVSRRTGARVLRITTAAGRVVEATHDHPFYVRGRWIEAAQLAAGDPLLCAVRDGSGSSSLRRAEAHRSRAPGFLLLERLLGPGDKRRAAWRTALCALRRVGASTAELGVARAGILLAGVSCGGARGGIRATGAGAYAPLRALQRHVSPVQLGGSFLFHGLRVAIARGSDARRGESALERWGVSEPREAARNPALPGDASAGDAARRAPLSALWQRLRSACASPGREPAEQPSGKSRDGVSSVSSTRAFLRREGDTIRAVEDLGRAADVFDIQVEGAHNFFANGVLVHNCLIVDDLIKDDKEAASQAIRDQAWNWLMRVAMTRRMGRKLMIVTHTRWHSDDPIGRFIDPENQHYKVEIAKKIKVINLPAFAEEDDPLGREIGEPLWPDGPDKFDAEFLNDFRVIDPLGFASLYQQRPTLAEGDLFKMEGVRLYDTGDLPDNLRWYAASDHALSTDHRRDPSCFGKAGVDQNGHIWLDELFWQRVAPEVAVETMLSMGTGQRQPLIWWAERGHISKSIGPFLKKRMAETQRFFNVVEVTPIGDKASRAASAVARWNLGMIHLPANASWTERFIAELMAFPNGNHDDAVDMLSLLCLGLRVQIPAAAPVSTRKEPKYGTFNWVKAQQRRDADDARRQRHGGF